MDNLTQGERGLLKSMWRSAGLGYDIRWKYRSQRGPYESLTEKGYLERREVRQTPYGEYVCYALTPKEVA